ncbi:hypothetical protein HALLA_12290 [Halostagnicola larsenii XH-48]|uniref:DUF2795 domain-containing protein n=1 Tax=Halostagnicola larsenii XH-48 TaxID=797299 RepID=W0JQ92_9EURY|nr:hypothetical protein [Halostagnicola larsenii]AHF99446.1 hypothetical protein HALLA_12290 [Halostagnicola larsenii XH-48]
MADDKNARDKKADDAERRQRKRELEEARDRADEPEPIDPESTDRLGELDDELETLEYPATTDDVLEAYGDSEIDAQNGPKSVAEVLRPVGDESYESADDVRARILGLLQQ